MEEIKQMRKRWIIQAMLLAQLVSTPVSGQGVMTITSPNLKTDATVSAGGEVYSFVRVYSVSGARIDSDTRAGDWLAETIIPAGTMLVSVPTSKNFKGCVPYPNSFEPAGPCFIDDDGDSRFDRQSRDQVVIFRKLKEPVPYSRQPLSIVRADSFKEVILYQGADANGLRFSYRQFKDDLARPAFTEDLVVPREPYPARIAIKNLEIEVLGVSGRGMNYRILAVK